MAFLTLPIIAGLSLAVSAVGVGVAAVSAMRQAEAESAAADYNEKIAGIRADSAEARGKVEEKQHRLRVSRLKGAQRVATAGAGVVVDQDTPLALLQETEFFGEIDALTIQQNAAQEAWGIRAGAVTGRRSPGLALGTTLLTGAGRLGSQFVDFKRAGVFSTKAKVR